jgi:hypothetical protein
MYLTLTTKFYPSVLNMFINSYDVSLCSFFSQVNNVLKFYNKMMMLKFGLIWEFRILTLNNVKGNINKSLS